MKLTALIVLIGCIQVSAEGLGQEVKLTLSMKEVAVGKVLKVIEQKSSYRFVYADNFFPSHLKVTVDVKETAVSIILQQVLQKTGFTFARIDDDLIVITSEVKSVQQHEIKGFVRAPNGHALEGVTVALQNTAIQTATNSNGEFNISVPEQKGVLVFSYVGYITRAMPFSEGAAMSVVLQENIRDLSEVVVVGYGTKTRREVTSAITRVNADQFNKGNISNVAQLLQGKVAGLSVSRPGGDPNAEFTLRLRGLSTLGANAQPLVVIDNQIGADLNTVDPNDIKSIDVLKDGSAAAIYGTRGSAGVIIITTKSGISGTPVIAYNTSGTMEAAGRFTSHMNADEYRKLKLGNDYGASTDWNKEITRKSFSHVHNLSLSGGAKGTSYNASINYRNNEGVAINTGNQQLNGRLSLIQKALKDKLVFNINLNTTRRKSQFGNSAAFKWATIYNPTAPVYSNDPRYDITGGGFFENPGILDYFNPVAALLQIANSGETKRLNLTGSAEYEIIPGLKLLVRYAQQTSSFNGNSYSPRTALSGGGFQKHGLANKRDDESFNQLYENTLTFHKKFSKLDVDALTGYSYQDFLNQGFQVGAGDFLTDASAENINSALDFRNGLATTSSYKNASRLIGFFGRLNFNYNNLAFLQASLRREGSSMLGENNQWGYFPSVSAGLDISQLTQIPFINNLKVRASFGITGALPPSPYLSLERLTNQGGSYYAGNGVYLQTYATFVNPNPNLKWERKEEIDLGLDFTFLDSRLSGSFDYYSRRTKDLIFNLTVPSPPNLNPTTWQNIGEIENNGIELSLSYDIVRQKALVWTSSLNYATYNITLAKLDESLKDSYVGASSLGSPGFSGLQVTRAVPGERIGILWGIRYLGLKSDSTYLFDDGTGKPTDFSKAKEMVLGNGLPDFEFGWSNTIRYKNFDLNLFFRGSVGHQLINTYRAFYETPKLTGYNPVNTKYFDPALKDGKKFSSLEVEKASFVKLDNATIGYNFPVSTVAGGAFKSIRVYFTGQNLFTITNYTGVDPEVRYTDVNDNGSINLLAPGVDRRETWVYTRAFTLGLNLVF
ncbi:MAG: SusC/RagA family TonB-linked outer membrane protein [Chitinophagaceae bacterium]|nr:SusC/RagA family TonB-linked outer membrane protein [Chitinophagaceae bacterium]